MSLFHGGKAEGDRHFRVVKLNGKEVEIGGVSITTKASPGDAARKLLSSIAHEKGLKKNKKLELGKVKFSIQEYTQGSKKKEYGPYEGHFHKYTAEELKKAKTAKGKQVFTMRPMVKLNKNGKSMNMVKKNKMNNSNNANKTKMNNSRNKVIKNMNNNNKTANKTANKTVNKTTNKMNNKMNNKLKKLKKTLNNLTNNIKKMKK